VAGRFAAAAVLALVVSGCGSDSTPADEVPALATRLDRVDAAIAAGDDARARTALRALTEATTRSQEAGDISSDQADRIVAAATELLARLPEEAPAPPTDPETSATTPPASEEAPAPTPHKPKDKDPKHHGHPKGKGHGKGH
jgi:ribosomal protein S20